MQTVQPLRPRASPPAAFVLVTTADLRPNLRGLADEIIRQLHGNPD